MKYKNISNETLYIPGVGKVESDAIFYSEVYINDIRVTEYKKNVKK